MWHVAWDYLSAALLLGWLTTAVFCAIAGTALAIWARWPWPVGFVVGLVGLGPGLALLGLVGAARAVQRRGAETAPTGASCNVSGNAFAVAAAPGSTFAPSRPGAIVAQSTTNVRGTGWRPGIVQGWQRWTRTPPTRAELALAVLCVLTSALAAATTFLGWVKVIGPGGVTLYSAGPFEIQLGLFVVFTAVVTVASAIGLLRWRSGWWPVLLAWCGTWWAFLAVSALSVRSELGSLSDLLDDTLAERAHVRQRVGVGLGPAWTVLLGLAALLLVVAVGMLVLQRSDPRRRVAASPRREGHQPPRPT